eukprot:2269827-Amphidinium_carterae.2
MYAQTLQPTSCPEIRAWAQQPLFYLWGEMPHQLLASIFDWSKATHRQPQVQVDDAQQTKLRRVCVRAFVERIGSTLGVVGPLVWMTLAQ